MPVIPSPIKLFITLVVTITLFACSPAETRLVKPDQIGTKILYQIYNDRQFNSLQPYFSEQMNQRLTSYGSINAIQNYVFRIKIEQIEIEVVEVGEAYFKGSLEPLIITYKLIGTNDGRRLVETCSLHFEYQENQWIVTKIIHDKFKTNY